MKLFQDSKGQTSSMRAMSFMVVFLIMLGWVIVSGLQHRLVEIPNSLLALVGMALSGKNIQKWIEEKVSDIDTKDIAFKVIEHIKVKK